MNSIQAITVAVLVLGALLSIQTIRTLAKSFHLTPRARNRRTERRSNSDVHRELAEARLEIERQRRQLAVYRTAALTDGLTGIANRRQFDQELKRRVALWKSTGTPVSLLMIDLDHFKLLNDHYGHIAGDAALHEVTQLLLDNVRATDVVARYGGDEFGIILGGAISAEAESVARRICNTVGDHVLHVGGEETRITVSIGAVQAGFGGDSETLIRQADAAMYEAKRAGRNMCRTHSGTSASGSAQYETGANSNDAEIAVDEPIRATIPLHRDSESASA